MLLLLLGGNVSFNCGPLTLSVLNARSVRNKGPFLADIALSNDPDFLCLTEAHICPSDSDCFYGLLPLLITYFLNDLIPKVLVVVLIFFI